MTARDITVAKLKFATFLLGCAVAYGLICLHGYVQQRDEAYENAARSHAAKQARSAAQADTWSELDARGRYMVSYDRIGK